jgi:signal transduction histidine kinase
MNRKNDDRKSTPTFFNLQSVQTRLPFLIFLLLVVTIIAFGWLSYIGIRKSTVEAGSLRLKTLSTQLSTMFAQSAQALVQQTRQEANKPAIRTYLQTAGRDSVNEAKTILNKLKSDTTYVSIQLLNQKQQIVLQSEQQTVSGSNFYITEALQQNRLDTGRVGKIVAKDNKLYYTIPVAVLNGKEIIGYLVRWRKMQATPEAIKRFSDLIGEGLTLHIGNADGSIWSDLNKQVDYLPDLTRVHDSIITYTHKNGSSYYAAGSSIKQTQWALLIELPKKNMTAASDRFLRIATTSGIIIIVIGIILTWIISRNITRPLNKLIAAVERMRDGDRLEKVMVTRKDELGVLADTFNDMSEQVYLSKKNLESTVRHRTSQLEASNKELEAFSYSVSHDLRAPLRAISGYATILKEDYEKQLDGEANRLIDTVVENANKMGRLIDDLISFARLGRKEDSKQNVDMKAMAVASFHELENQYPATSFKLIMNDIPDAYTDENLLKQVWLNLIGNAMKYAGGKPSPTIEIGSKQELDKIIYFVRDNGVGFDMKYAHKLFGVFQRLHNSDEFEGTGIGLALVKRIIEKQGGTVWAEGETGKGAVFYFSLPLNHKK